MCCSNVLHVFTGFLCPRADKSQLRVLPGAICCCLDTCNVYVVLLTLFCIIMHKLSWSLVLTSVVIGTFSLLLKVLPEAISLAA